MPTQRAMNCRNEYDKLKKVIVVPPTFMEIREIINEVQASYAAENIDKKIAGIQHEHFVRTLEAEGAEIIQLKPDEKLNEQVFTRDIGFTINGQLFIANMEEAMRKPETALLKQWVLDRGLTFEQLTASPIEGGDVVIDGNTVWIGISDRTCKAAVEELRKKLPDMEVVAVPMRKDILHLDCIFNLVDSNTALVFPPGIDDQDVLQKLRNRYEFIEVTEDEQFQLGTNVLSIGNKKVISLPENKRINKELEKKGFQVIEVPFSEIIKSGGSFRCCTLPLLRA